MFIKSARFNSVSWNNFDFERIDLKKSRKNTDFGTGFYTTLLEPQAKEWGLRLATMTFSKEYFVNKYSYHPADDVKIKRFNKCTLEWLEMIRENRSKGGVQHDYDIVFGPVADDNTLPTIQRYMQGRLSASEAIQRLEYTRITNQISFHTKKGLDCLWLLGKDRYYVER